jgi:hypothetical protein
VPEGESSRSEPWRLQGAGAEAPAARRPAPARSSRRGGWSAQDECAERIDSPTTAAKADGRTIGDGPEWGLSVKVCPGHTFTTG